MKSTSDLPGPDGTLIWDDWLQSWMYIDGHGQTVVNVHPRELCERRGACAIHAPSEHPMRAFPTLLRIPGPFDIKPLHMERICPHGTGHPDPDDLAYWVERGDPSMGVHGCDGCCKSVPPPTAETLPA